MANMETKLTIPDDIVLDVIDIIERGIDDWYDRETSGKQQKAIDYLQDWCIRNNPSVLAH